MNFLQKIKNMFGKNDKKPVYVPKPEVTKEIHRLSKQERRYCGGFGKCHNSDCCDCSTLKVIPKSKRTKDNCNSCGVQND